jgi:ABC-type uncharacterized transport system involved in gliding motility auxiliary subunit
MRIGVTILTDAKGDNFVLAGGKALPLTDLAAQKSALKLAAVQGMKVGGKAFSAGMLVTQYGVDIRKKFAALSGKDVQA